MRKYRHAAAAVAFMASVTACGTGPVSDQGGQSAVIEGSQRSMTLPQLAEAADAVVVASAGKPQERAFTDNPAILKDARAEVGFAESRYEQVPLSVEQVLAGDPGPAPTVARLTSLVERPGAPAQIQDSEVSLEEGQRYLLFLSEGDRLWRGHLLVLGIQGIAEVRDGTAVFRTGETLPMSEVETLLG